jgi:hypothetical protein
MQRQYGERLKFLLLKKMTINLVAKANSAAAPEQARKLRRFEEEFYFDIFCHRNLRVWRAPIIERLHNVVL